MYSSNFGDKFDSFYTQLLNDRLYRDPFYDTGIVDSMVRYEPQRPVEIGIDDEPQCLWHECSHCSHRLPDNPKYCIGTNSDDVAVFECDYCDTEIIESDVIHHHQSGTKYPDIDEWIECPYCGNRIVKQTNVSLEFDWNQSTMTCAYCNETVEDDRAIIHQNYDEF